MTESTAEDHPRSGWKERLKSQLLRTLFDAAVAGGKAHVRYLTHLGFPKERIGLYYDVVDNSTYDRRTSQIRRVSPGQFALPSNPYFLYVGRLSPEKNIFELVDAWLSYREAGGNWPLVIVGDGPCMPQIRASVEGSKQAEALLLVGHKSSEELPIYYAFAGCFVLPSTREPWGLVVNEAMACGLPVLVSVACGSSEDLVKDGANGLTFKPGTGELVTRLHQMSNLNSDQRYAMGTRSRMIIANYSPQRFGLEVQSLIFSPEA